jgi:hypothetical protein
MPDLSALNRPRLVTAAFNSMFLGAGILGQPDNVLALKIVALCETAISQYQQARSLLAPGRRSGHTGGAWLKDYYTGLASTEFCFSALDRAFGMVTQLDQRGTLPQALDSLLPSRNARSCISQMRNAIEHADRDIASGRVEEGQSALLYASRHAFEIGSRSITHRQLADDLTRLAGFVDAMSVHRPEGRASAH